jgi:integrase/recombinase XerD
VRVQLAKQGGVVGSVALVGEGGSPVQPASRFLQHLLDAGNSPNTAAAYGYDLPYLFEFFAERGLDWREFRPAIAFDLPGWPLGASAGGDRAVRDGRHAHPARGRQRW